jgi:outer membrane lipoprotein SlyB
MEIVIKSDDGITTIRIQDKDATKLIDAIYWFLRENKINPIIETTNI